LKELVRSFCSREVTQSKLEASPQPINEVLNKLLEIRCKINQST
jgi:hypothetical protein